MHPIEILKPGTFTDRHGRPFAFTGADVAAIAARYDPELSEAPLVVGHPTHDAPAYGWVKGLEAGDTLAAVPHQVEPQFADLVAAGRFKKVSASFYRPDSPNNPAPGGYYLKHVGFLGAAAPAVKGLRSVEFTGGDEDLVEIEFGDWGEVVNAGLWRRMREWILERFGKEDADQAVPGWEVGDLEKEAERTPASPESEPYPVFSEPPKEEPNMETITLSPAQLQAKIKEAVTAAVASKETEFSQREDALKTQEAAARRAGIDRFITDLEAQGKLLPAWKPGLAEFMEALEGIEAELEFGEGDAAVKASPGEHFRGLLEGMGSHPLFKEMARPPEETGAVDPELAEDEKTGAEIAAYVGGATED